MPPQTRKINVMYTSHVRSLSTKVRRLLLGLVVGSCGASPVVGVAHDFGRDAPPVTWVEDLVPEKDKEPEYREYFDMLDKAREQVNAGQYRRALATLHTFKTDDAEQTRDRAMLSARALGAIGRHAAAIDELSVRNLVDQPAVQVLRAEILAWVGRTDEAIALLKRHVEQVPDSLTARLQLGLVQEQVGDLDAARDTYGWFVNGPVNYLERWRAKNDPLFESAETTVTVARAVDRWATLSGQYAQMPRLHQTILDMLIESYDRIDRTYRPARVAAAEFFLARDNRGEAQKELEAAMKMNPNDPYVLNLIGTLLVGAYRLDQSDALAVELNRVAPGSPEAALLRARSMLRLGQARAALPMIDRVLAGRPRDLEALSLQAAARALQLDDDGLQESLSNIDAMDPDNATSRVEIADALSFSHQDERAIPFLNQAVERAPWWASARHTLGKVNMEVGLEDDARVALEAAYSVDPYNATTVNFLRLLDDMQKFQVFETEHLRFLFTQADASVVVNHFAPYLEKVWPQLCERFGYTPPWKPSVQIFPDRDTFSVRVAGLPGFENYGVAQGRAVITLSPRASASMGTFNWARVLTHELAHTVHLSKTGGRVPRWLTEGLAVGTENVAFRFEWVPPVLWHAATNDRIPRIAALTDTIQNPKRPVDSELGYMTGCWIGQYIETIGGREAIVKLLHAYSEGKSDDDAFRASIGMSVSEFEPKFHAWAKDLVKTWGYDPETTRKYKALVETGDAQTKSNQYDEAIRTWNEALALQPMNLTPRRRLAGLYLKQNRPKDALPHLEAVVPLELSDNRFSKRIARIYRDAGDIPSAIRKATEAIYITPFDPTAHELLAELHEQAGEKLLADRDRKIATELKAQQDKINKERDTVRDAK